MAKRSMQVTSAMFDTLSAIVAHDRTGRAADPDFYPTGSILALVRRNLICRDECGWVRPTLDGIRLVCGVEGHAL